MADQLKIKILGTLDSNLTTTEINKQLLNIEKKINKLRLNVSVDSSKLSSVLKEFSQMQSKLKNSKVSVVSDRDTNKVKEIYDSLDKAVAKYKQFGSVKIDRTFNPATKELEKFQLTITRANGEVEKLKFQLASLKGIKGIEGFALTGRSTIDDTAKIREQQMQQQQKVSRQVTQSMLQDQESLRNGFRKLFDQGKISENRLKNFNKIIDSTRNVAEIEKVKKSLQRVSSAVDNKALQQKLISNADTLLRTHSNTVDRNGVRQLIANLNNVRPSADNAANSIRNLQNQLRGYENAARESARSSMSVMDAFRTAMVKFPIWIAASTAFYGSLHSLQNTVGIIIEVDTRLTNLKKVMDEDTNFDNIMDNARISAERFGKTLVEVLDAYSEFARQGYKEQDLINLGEAGLITSNVGEISSAQAAQYLTSAMVQFNVASKDSMQIIDAWNNISNRNATTVEKLAQGMAKAGATANSFSLDMHELNAIVGTVTAATKQSGNEIGNFVKSSLPRLLSQPAQDALKSLNINFMDPNTGDMRDVIDIYAEVADKVKNISNAEKAAVMEGLAGKFHISRMTALIDNWSLFEKTLNDSRDSIGSASRENETYMQSLQARINLMKQSFEELALTFGESFVTESFIQTLQGLKSFAEGASGVVKTVGGLPIILGTVSFATAALSKSFRATAAEARILQGVFTTLGVTSKTLRGAIAATGVGAVAVGLGIGIEFLLRKMGEARQRVEEFESKNRELANSFKANQTDVESLLAQYERLGKVIQTTDYSPEQLSEFNRVRNELANLMPELVQGEDQYGNKLIGTSESIRAQIELIQRQIDLQERLDAIKKKEEVQKTKGDLEKSIDDAEKRLREIEKISIYNIIDAKSIEDVEKMFDSLSEKIANGEDLTITDKIQYDKSKEIIENYRMTTAELDSLRASYQKSIMDLIDANVTLDESTSKTTKGMINDFSLFVATSEMGSDKIGEVFDDVLKSLDSKEFTGTLQSYGNALEDYQDKIDKGYSVENLERYKDKVKSSFEEVKNALINLLPKGTDKEIINSIAKSLTQSGNSALVASIDFEKLSKSTGKTTEELKAQLAMAPDLSGELGGLSDASLDAADSQDQFATAAERLISVSSGQVDSLYELIGTYKVLSQMEGNSAETSAELVAVTNQLAAAYPHLVKGKQVNIEILEQEAKANDILLKATEDLLKGNLTAEQQKTTATAIQAKTRIDILKQELAAQNAIVQKFNEMSKTLADNANSLEQEKLATKAYQRAQQLTADINLEMPDYQGAIDSLANSIDYHGRTAEATKKATDKASESYKNATYVSDKFREALDRINFALEKQRAIQETFPKHSKQYQTALKNEISLLDQKKKLLEDQTKSLQAQIKAGKIQQTGIISSPTSTVSSSSNSYAKGSSVQDTVWNFLKSKGFTDNIVAGIMGNFQLESNFNPSNVNKSSGAYGLAQWLGGRKKALSSYASSQGTSMSDLNTQLNFLWKELNSTEKRTLNYLNSNQNASAAQIAAMFDKLFERSEGTHVPIRQKYANQILAKYSGTTPVSTVSSSASEASKEAAEQAQAVDQAKSELLQLQQDAMGVGAEIQRLQLELIKTPLYQAENRFRQIDSQAKIYDARLEKQDEWSEGYRKNLQNQNILLKEKKKLTEQNMIYIEKELKTNINLTEIQKDELRQTYLDLRDTLVDIDNQIVENINRNTESLALEVQKRIDDTLKKIQDKMNNFEYGLSYEQARGQNLEKGSKEYASNIRNQSIYIKDQLATVEEEQKAIEKLLKTEKLSAEQKEELRKRYKELNLESVSLRNELVNLNDELNDSVVNILEEQRTAYFDGLRKDFYAQSELLEKQIEDAEDYYDPLIEAKQEQLKLLDEEYEKEDRLKRLREIDDEINDVKNDKRFSYITEQGEEILTYDKARVSELEKERDELLKQYQREDIKKAIQDEIDNLEKVKDDRIELLNEELKELQENYDLQIEEEEKRWDELIQSAQEGTLGYSELMNSWYGTSIASLTQYGVDLATQIENIKALYASMDSLKTLETSVSSPASGSGSSTGGSSSGTSKTFSSAKEERDFRAKNPNDPYTVAKDTRHIKYLEEKGVDNWSAADKIDYEKLTERQGLDEHHEGGIVGQGKSNRLTELANKLFNVKPNEQVIKSLKGELQVPPKNIPNLFTNIGNMVSSLLPNQSPVATQSGDTFHLHNVTIQANNPQELWKGLQMQIRMNK